VCYDIVSILLWGQLVGCCDDLVDYRSELVSRKLLEHPLYDSTASAVTTQLKQLGLDQRQHELDVLCRQVQDDALQNVVALLAEHHAHQLRWLKLTNDFDFALER